LAFGGDGISYAIELLVEDEPDGAPRHRKSAEMAGLVLSHAILE
jgi:hypothetical protein